MVQLSDESCHTKVMWVAEVTRLAVTLHDYVDTSKYRDDKNVFQHGQKHDRPSSAQLEELEVH